MATLLEVLINRPISNRQGCGAWSHNSLGVGDEARSVAFPPTAPLKRFSGLNQRPVLIPQILWATVFLSGVLLPFIIVWKSGTHLSGDYKIFSFWAECWFKDSGKIYLNCGANYPFVGIIASAGALSTLKTLLGAEDYPQLVHRFQFYLAIFDALNFILVWLLARALKLKYALAVSVLIAALPSSWAGGALWGQIDDASQFFLLACVLCLVTGIQSNSDKLNFRSVTCCVLGLLALVAFVLTKQMAVFSLPAVLPLAFLACLRLWTSGRKLVGPMAAASAILLCVAFFEFLDSRLEVPLTFQHPALPPLYHASSYLFIWLGGGSSHGNVISVNGFNIWMFLERDMWSSSKEPFYCLRFRDYEFCLTPFHSGAVLYCGYIVILSASFIAFFLRPLLGGGFRDEMKMRFVLATIILYLAQVNLGFNVFLTGTHERYLYHCFPFLILSAFYFLENTQLLSWYSTVFFIVAATLYGGFILLVPRMSPYLSLLRLYEFYAATHLVLLIYLLILSFRLPQWGEERGDWGESRRPAA
jgi:hypothetical protein